MSRIIKYSILIMMISLSLGQASQVGTPMILESLLKPSINTLIIETVQLQNIKPLKAFYQEREYQPIWTPSKAKELLQNIKESQLHGLRAQDYHLSEINQLILSPKQHKQAHLELLLSDAFILLNSHYLSGKLKPKTLDPNWHVNPQEGNPLGLLKQVSLQSKITPLIQSSQPQHPTYHQLQAALKHYLQLPNTKWSPIKPPKGLKLGDNHPILIEVKERLILLQDMEASQEALEPTYDQQLQQSLKGFQARHGIDTLGTLGPETIQALNFSRQERINKIKVNLERWRWLPRDLGNYHIIVNIANFKMKVIRDSETIAEHKVISGKPFRQTPVFSSTMQYLVLNPTWTVPPGILRADVFPELKKGTKILTKKKLNVYDQEGKIVPISSESFTADQVRKYKYIQPPGPENALGAVKFMFPNPYHVYLHDTPSRELFDKNERAFSSGCIRVHQPLDLAALLLKGQDSWDAKSIAQVVKTQKTQNVTLKNPPQVHILYWTSWFEGAKVQFRKDIYNRDLKVLKALDLKSEADLL